MARRAGEFKLSTLDRFYPFHVAVLLHRADRSERFRWYGEMDAFYRSMNEAPRQNSFGRGETEHIVYGFASEAAARAFQDRFGGFRIEPTDKARREAEARL